MGTGKPARIPEPPCEERACFANKNKKCIVLSNNDFHGKPCPFFKTEEQLERERRDCARKNKRLGTNSHTGEAVDADPDDDFLARVRAAMEKARESDEADEAGDGDWSDEETDEVDEETDDWSDGEDWDDDRNDGTDD